MILSIVISLIILAAILPSTKEIKQHLDAEDRKLKEIHKDCLRMLREVEETQRELEQK